MISVTEAFGLIQQHLPNWGNTETHLSGLQGSVLSQDLKADREYPPYHRVMMDGIALSWESYKKGQREFFISGLASAGAVQGELKDEKSCWEVMTGAPLPIKCTLVIPYEHLRIEGKKAWITTEIERPLHDNIHLKGSDCSLGDIVLRSGQIMHGPHWGIASSLGYNTVQTQNHPRVKIISTGDELVEVAATPLPHQIRRSNAYALKASLKNFGLEEVELDHVKDDPREIEKHYQGNVCNFDLLIYSGGVSKGKFDYLPSVWADQGVKKHFHEVRQRPGKPLWFGVDEKHHTAILGLPGNPVSSLVCLHRYLLGGREMYAKLSHEIIFKKDLTFFVPVKIQFEKDGSLVAIPLPMKNSGEFLALAESDGFLELPSHQTVFQKGEAFRFFSWGKL